MPLAGMISQIAIFWPEGYADYCRFRRERVSFAAGANFQRFFRAFAKGMPTTSAIRLQKSSQSVPSRPRIWAASNQEFVVGDSDRSFSTSRPFFAMMVQDR